VQPLAVAKPEHAGSERVQWEPIAMTENHVWMMVGPVVDGAFRVEVGVREGGPVLDERRALTPCGGASAHRRLLSWRDEAQRMVWRPCGATTSTRGLRVAMGRGHSQMLCRGSV